MPLVQLRLCYDAVKGFECKHEGHGVEVAVSLRAAKFAEGLAKDKGFQGSSCGQGHIVENISGDSFIEVAVPHKGCSSKSKGRCTVLNFLFLVRINDSSVLQAERVLNSPKQRIQRHGGIH